MSFLENRKLAPNEFSFECWGNRALFCDPRQKQADVGATLMIPPSSAIAGLARNIRCEPGVILEPIAVRVMNRIQMGSITTRGIRINSNSPKLLTETYLKDVRYQVLCRFVWDRTRPEFSGEWNTGKWNAMINRHIEQGTRRHTYFGRADYPAFIKPCAFGEGEGYYDDTEEIVFSNTSYGIIFPEYTKDNKRRTCFYDAHMKNGVIVYPDVNGNQVHQFILQDGSIPA